MIEEKLLKRIQDLLNLRESSNEHEASLAAAKVQELLQRYNLDEEKIKSHQNRSSIVSIDIEYLSHIKWARDWEIRLAGVIAQGNFCRVLFTSVDLTIVGRKLNAEVTRDVFIRVRSVLHDLSLKRLEEYGQAWREKGVYDLRTLGKGRRSQEFRRGWLQGVLEGIATQIYQQQKSFEAQTATQELTGMELISLRENEVEDSIKDAPEVQIPDIGEHRAGRWKGQQDGLKVSLHRADLESKE